MEDRVKSDEKPTAHALGSVRSATGLPADGRDVTGPSKVSALPLNRQFWRAGSYGAGGTPLKTSVPDGENHAHVHPMFLHSNATSHKWVFGAVAELLDNAIDEIQNGATLILVDRTVNPRDGSSALLIQDDGGGMDPEALRRCMSFGFSDKRSKAAIGQYGNGFKTSTMRLGADVIVFSRHKGDRGHSQSIGLLSYTFLTQTGCNRIIVPMVDYVFNETTKTVENTPLYGRDHFDSNLSLLLQWSPYSTEADLLKQFDDIGSHGTKVIIYNLWMTDDRKMELDFDADHLDIRLSGDIKKVNLKPHWKLLIEKHIANQLHHSLRVYLSILYLRLPDSFTIVLRGQAVEHHNIADDLKYIEYILYTPQTGGTEELVPQLSSSAWSRLGLASYLSSMPSEQKFVCPFIHRNIWEDLIGFLKKGKVITTIGFLKEAPNISVHGFNVYNKNRLILPFWQVLSRSNSRGRGVVGVLEANFIEPTHNKQDFERTSLFQKLEVRLKEMAKEYWAYHCGLIGYHDGPKHLQSGSIADRSRALVQNVSLTPMTLSAQTPPTNRTNKVSGAPSGNRYYQGSNLKRKAADLPEIEKENQSEGAGTAFLDNLGHPNIETVTINQTWWGDSEINNIIEEHRKLREKCLEHEKSEQELNDKLANLRGKLESAQKEYTRLLAKSQFLEQIKQDRMQR